MTDLCQIGTAKQTCCEITFTRSHSNNNSQLLRARFQNLCGNNQPYFQERVFPVARAKTIASIQIAEPHEQTNDMLLPCVH